MGKKVNPETGRIAEFYRCAICGGSFTNTSVEVDHITPVVDPKLGFVDWNTFISRLFSSKENYQLICKSCHKDKTKQERQLKKNAKS